MALGDGLPRSRPRRLRVRGSLVRVAIALAIAAGHVAALDVPQGGMPGIDGVLGADEWKGAARLVAPEGEAFLRASGRALCIGVRMARPYRGERLDLHVTDDAGLNYSWHAFHPACTIPPLSLFPIAPVIVRHGSYEMAREAPFGPPQACVARASVYREARAWSAEMAVALEALDAAPLGRVVFRLDVLHPADETPPVLFAPPAGDDPGRWQTLSADWPGDAPAFRTAQEDERRAFEFSIFLESMAAITGRPAPATPLADALDGRKSAARIDELLGRLDACLEADPLDLFARVTKVSVLRRANRLDAAWEAFEPFWRLEAARSSLLGAGIRRQLLVAAGRFDEAAALDLPGSEDFRVVSAAWRSEMAARARDGERGDLPRVAFETTRGRIVVELLEDDAPAGVAYLLSRAAAGAYADAPVDPVVGAAFAQAGPAPADASGILFGDGERRAWRGSVAFAPDGALLFATGHRDLAAVGRIIEGMDAADALDSGDRISSVTVIRKRDHDYAPRRR